MKEQKNLLKKQKKKHSFTTVYNAIFEDKSLTLRDVGLYTYMLSKPDDWHFSVRGIASQRIESKDTIAKILNNLITNGWLSREAIKNNGKYFVYVYEIFYQKQNITSLICKTPSPNKPDTENRTVSNNYTKKEREVNFYDENKSSILKYIDYLEKNGNIKNKQAHKKTIIKRFMTDDKPTIEVFEEWRLDVNINTLLLTFNNKVFSLECENKMDDYYLIQATKNNFHIVLLFQGIENENGTFNLRQMTKNINEAISFLSKHLKQESKTNEK